MNIAEPLAHLAIPIDDLNLDPKNARTHDERNINAIKDSLEKFGQRLPIVVQKEGMIVRAGNGRVIAARAMGWTEIAAVVVDEGNVEATAFALADNRSAELAAWDDEALRLALSTLEAEDVDALGWDEKELGKLMAGGTGEVTEDEIPEPPEEPKSKLGDLYALGDHRVLCGDSTKDLPSDWSWDCIVSDPPYGMDYTGTAGTAQDGMMNEQRREVRPVEGDDRDFDPGWMLDATAGDVLLFGGDWFYQSLPPNGSWIVWDKRASVDADAIPGAPFEVCWSRRRQARRFIRVPWGGWNNTEVDEGKRWHPTQKPVLVMVEAVRSALGDVILDPYLGSGTTLIAAEQLGRTCYGIEISPRYVDVIIERWQNLTGKTAELIS